MKLTQSDINLLKNWGHPDSDIRQIEEATAVTSYTLIEGDEKEEKISRNEAMSVLGREDYLSGISRSAFHWTSMRGKEGRQVYFDSSRLFQ